jgi:hypothetical protein
VNDDIYSAMSAWNHVNFTPNSKRFMRLVRDNNHPSCSDLLTAIDHFDTHVKVILSKRDVAQLEHTDIIEPYVRLRPQD